MDAEKYRRSVAMHCPICGSGQFEFDSEEGTCRCVTCGRKLTHEELISENRETIDAHAEEMGAEVLRDAAKEVRARLRKAFKGSKSFKIK